MANLIKLEINEFTSKWMEATKIFLRGNTGKFIYFWDDTRIEPYTFHNNTNFLQSMGIMSYSHTANISPHAFIECGRYCSLASGIRTKFNHRHPYEYITSSPITHNVRSHIHMIALEMDLDFKWPQFTDPQKSQKITIGHDVWIGSDVFIASGVNIGHGAIIAANSVVTKDIPPYQIAGGNPARIIKSRFEPSLIDSILATEWWMYHPKLIAQLSINNPIEFVSQFSQIKQHLEKISIEKINISELMNYANWEIL